MHEAQLLAELTALAGGPCDSGPEGDYGSDGQDRWHAEIAAEYIDHPAAMVDILRNPPAELPTLSNPPYISEVEDLLYFIQILLGMMMTYRPKVIALLIGPHLRDAAVRGLLLQAVEDAYAGPLLPWLVPLVDKADELSDAELKSLAFAIRSTGSRKVLPLYERLATVRPETAVLGQALDICYKSLSDRYYMKERKRRRQVIEQGFRIGALSYWNQRNEELARERRG